MATLSRRAFFRGYGAGAVASPVLAALVSARGFEEVAAEWTGGVIPTLAPPAADEVRIGGNENPLGPGKVALDALLALAAEHPRLIVARTFSKAYGLAGLRIGYGVGHKDNIKKMAEWRGLDVFTSLPGRVAAIAAIQNQDHLKQEVARNAKVRALTRKWFHDQGYEDTDSQANFVYIDIRQSNDDFKKAARTRGVRIGGGSKLYPNHARVTIGTIDEMKRAFEVFSEVLSNRTSAVA